jgi:hypothetical protein
MRLAVVLFVACGLCPAQDVASTVQRIADVGKKLPWFWSPPYEGLADLPYTYEMTEQRQTGKHPATSFRLERIGLDAGSYYRCLAQNGKSPCVVALSEALEADSHKAANFTPEEKANAKAARAERFRKRQAFWAGFPAAFQFTEAGPGQLRFAPKGKAPPEDAALLGKIAGDLWFDPRTFEIVGVEYRMTADGGEPASRMPKGTTFAMTTAPAADGRNVPLRSVLHRAGKTPESSSFEFANYRRFTADSTVDFTGPDKQ